MIPKLLHYIWLGGKKSDHVNTCIDSFHKYMSDYEIIEWNESSIDLNWFNDNELSFYNKYYKIKRYAFCSDLARLHILKRFGGIYVDTDVEFIRHLPDAFLAKPIISRITPHGTVCNGCIWGCEKDDKVVDDLINIYSDKISTSIKSHGKTWIFNTLFKNFFISHGDDVTATSIVDVCGYNVYPCEYFCPMDSITKTINITNNTVSIHHFDLSWKR